MILEAVTLWVRSGESGDFEEAFRQAVPLVKSIDGYRSHQLQRCMEQADRYLLLIYWDSLEAHVEGFRKSPQYQQWKALLHHFYDPFPTVLHYQQVAA